MCSRPPLHNTLNKTVTKKLRRSSLKAGNYWDGKESLCFYTMWHCNHVITMAVTGPYHKLFKSRLHLHSKALYATHIVADNLLLLHLRKVQICSLAPGQSMFLFLYSSNSTIKRSSKEQASQFTFSFITPPVLVFWNFLPTQQECGEVGWPVWRSSFTCNMWQQW